MQQYYIGITKTWQLIAIMVFAPLIGVPFIVFGALYGPKLPEWAMLTAIYSLIGVGVVAPFLLIKKVQHKAILTMNDNGFSVSFEDNNLFTLDTFEIRMSDVERLTLNGKTGVHYLSFAVSVYPMNFNIEARSKNKEDQTAFYDMAEVVTLLFIKEEERRKGISS